MKVQLTEKKVTVSSDGYLVCPPALHPRGCVYEFVETLAPWETGIATLPLSTVERLAREARLAREVACVTTGPISAGDRHEHLRRIAWVMRRYSGASLEGITAALLAENVTRCDPPKDERLVRALARYTCDHWSPKGA